MSRTTLSLQALQPDDANRNSLQYIIERIKDQKGTFLDVTEESLEDEIKQSVEDETVEDEDMNMEEVEEEVEDDKSRRERILKARAEMLKQISEAQSSSQMALDLVSLILAPRTPGPASLTLSPIVKQTLPVGSMAAEVMKGPGRQEPEEQKDGMLSMGWRMQSLNRAANTLLDSASRLQKEMKKEATFWNQVVKVKESGWSLSRMPREKHTLRVHFGFAEAAPYFRERGLAALRRDEDGSVYLDRGLLSSSARVRLRIFQHGREVASFSGNSKDQSDASLEQEILNARDDIYDSELFHELRREAQLLTNQGVQCTHDTIVLPYDKDKQIEISLPPTHDSPTEPSDNHTETALLKDLLLTFRLLLSQAHLQSLEERSQPPPPIQGGPQARPVYAILKPILEILSHRTHVLGVDSILRRLQGSMRKTGLPFNISTSRVDSQTSSVPPGSSRPQAVADFIASLINTQFDLSFPDSASSSTEDLTIKVSTSIAPPTFGTRYEVFQASEKVTSNSTNTTFSALNDLQLEIEYRLQSILRLHVLSIPGWKDAKLGARWIHRESRKGGGVKEDVAIDVERGEVKVAVMRKDGVNNRGGQSSKRAFLWSGEDGGEKRSLKDVLAVSSEG